MAVLKYSRQREAIKNFLMSRDDHPTADVVYENIKMVYPNISLGTVYRNLSLLSDIGEITKLSNFGSADRFDGRTDPHCHFICTECGKVMDMDNAEIFEVLQTAGKNFNGSISSVSARFSGTCGDCLNRHKKNSKSCLTETNSYVTLK